MSHTIKSCGKAHAWCLECRPGQSAALSKPRRKEWDGPPCRNCGTCDRCMGLQKDDGTKFCRTCREYKPLNEFHMRRGRRRNQCKQCIGYRTVKDDCSNCGKRFHRGVVSSETMCPDCRIGYVECRTCKQWFVRSLKYRAYCSEGCRSTGQRSTAKANRQKLRDEMVGAYGGRCACQNCPETDPAFLTLDHVNGDGRAHRKRVGSHTYSDLRQRGWPQEGFRLLCWNCNAMTRFGPCPHGGVPYE